MLLLIGCRQNVSDNQSIPDKVAQLEELWGNVSIVEERVLDGEEPYIVCAFEDSYERLGIAFFKKEKTGEYVLDSSTFLKGSIVSENKRIGDVNYIAYYSKESDVAYLEVTEDGKCEKYDINGLFILEKAVGEEVSVDIKYYEDSSSAFTSTQTLTMFNNTLYLLSDDDVYEYKDEKHWKKVESDDAVKQVVDGEIPCAIDIDGKVLCEEFPAQEENLPLSSAYAYDMAKQLLQRNEEQDFLWLSDSLLISPIALLEGNVIMYPRNGQYETYQMEEDVQMLSGNFVLTKAGNVYRVASEAPDWDESVVSSAYDGGDIVVIGADQNAGLCIGLTGQGKVVWIECGSARAEKVQDEVESWSEIVNIAVSTTKICGLESV